MHEDYARVFWEYNVGLTRQFSNMKPKAIPESVE